MMQFEFHAPSRGGGKENDVCRRVAKSSVGEGGLQHFTFGILVEISFQLLQAAAAAGGKMCADWRDTIGSAAQHFDDLAAQLFFGFMNNTDFKFVAGGGFFNKKRFAVKFGKPISQTAERINGHRGDGIAMGKRVGFQLGNDVRINELLEADDFIAQLQLHFFEALLGKLINTVEFDFIIKFAMLFAHGFQPFYQQQVFVHGSDGPYVFDFPKNMRIIAKKWP